MNTLVSYHFFLIWMLSLLSMATHNATLLALVHDYRRDWVIRWMRQFLMFVNLALSSVSGVFVLQSVSKDIHETTLPIACVWQVHGEGPAKSAVLSYVGTITVIVGNCAIFAMGTWYLHSRSQKFYKAVQILGLAFMTAAAVGAAVRICLLSQAFGHPTVKLNDRGEEVWSFGQLLSMLILIYPLVTVVEIYRGEVKVALPAKDGCERLYDGELQTYPQTKSSLQPNPFFGSRASPFGKNDDGFSRSR
ncbi:hypothetical protein QQS21_003189 [Conoideocrella luteorostrata]|uniref:Uncharacterized protein n=1 Tax=Conoideocrella luteorostrata TaxID=1105319 RepID=A0AAJ0CWI8_9HYPO|nr:hypothetical protein QQS21_003189 [Conoideocrella luteorostrata]